jgi:heat shock protein 4
MSHVCDRAFGGKDLDEMLFQHFADEFKSKYKVDARTEQKASLRLKMQVRI